MTDCLRIALTPGEPAGIGPDLAVMLAQSRREHEIVAIADPAVLQERANLLGLPLSLRLLDKHQRAQGDAPGTLCVLPVTAPSPVTAGVLDANNASYVIETLRDAVNGCLAKEFSAMVTAPVHKGIINDAGIPFSGHTEFIAEMTGGHPVMMLLSDTLRVALATTHIPVSQIATSINQPLLLQVLQILHNDLKQRFNIARPHILVCGLNPHAGESGHLGREEIDTIEPALETLRKQGLHITGPLPADTLFTPRHLSDADAVLAMYHDQGLPVLKYAGFGQAVNLTLGLPIVRTSVDHGTAIDLAGSRAIDQGSLLAALDMAVELA